MADNEKKSPEKVSAVEEITSKSIKELVNKNPLLALCGSGKQLWRDEHADEYVRRLREDW